MKATAQQAEPATAKQSSQTQIVGGAGTPVKQRATATRAEMDSKIEVTSSITDDAGQSAQQKVQLPVKPQSQPVERESASTAKGAVAASSNPLAGFKWPWQQVLPPPPPPPHTHTPPPPPTPELAI